MLKTIFDNWKGALRIAWVNLLRYRYPRLTGVAKVHSLLSLMSGCGCNIDRKEEVVSEFHKKHRRLNERRAK